MSFSIHYHKMRQQNDSLFEDVCNGEQAGTRTTGQGKISTISLLEG